MAPCAMLSFHWQK